MRTPAYGFHAVDDVLTAPWPARERSRSPRTSHIIEDFRTELYSAINRIQRLEYRVEQHQGWTDWLYSMWAWLQTMPKWGESRPQYQASSPADAASSAGTRPASLDDMHQATMDL